MDKLTDEELNGTDPVVFATNLLTIIVPAGNPAGVTGVEDLANPDLKVVLCAEEVPCGNYANQILDERRGRRDAGQLGGERARCRHQGDRR